MTKRTKNDGPKYSAEAYGAPAKEPLIDRQRRLYAYAEEIEIADARKLPLRPGLAKWLSVALKNIACGEDTELCLNVLNDKTERRDGFLLEMQRKHANGFVAAATAKDDPQSLTNQEAFKQAAAIGPKPSTVRKNWNKQDAKRDGTYTLTDK